MYSEHTKILRGLNYPEEALRDISAWQTSPHFDAAERCVLAYADCIGLDHGRTPASLFDQLKSHFTEEQIIELTYVASMFMMHAGMIRALRLEHDDYDDIVREMPSPLEYRFVDVEPMPLPPRSGEA
jgi:alkylhydroperoxidase family enzyme